MEDTGKDDREQAALHLKMTTTTGRTKPQYEIADE